MDHPTDRSGGESIVHCQEETRASVSTGRIAILASSASVTTRKVRSSVFNRSLSFFLLYLSPRGSCAATFLIICIVVWDGIPKHEADDVYKLLIHKLNKFGLPTTRRCATNENRTCACQGEDLLFIRGEWDWLLKSCYILQVLIPKPVVLRTALGVLGPCTTTAASMRAQRLSASSG